MSKKYGFTRFTSNAEPLNTDERKERMANGTPIQNRIVFQMDPDKFLEHLFGVEDFFFIPIATPQTYRKSMVEQGTSQCLYLLQQAAKELDSDLYAWMSHFLHSVNSLIQTKGWTHNISTEEDVDTFNETLDNVPYSTAHLKVENPTSSFTLKNLSLYVDEQTGKIATSYDMDFSECIGFDSLVLYQEKGLSPVEKLECGINFLYDWVMSLESNNSSTNIDIKYERGQTDIGVHVEFLWTLKKLAQCMSYLMHSTSWRENELFHFDILTLSSKANNRINKAFCHYFEGHSEATEVV